MAATASARPDSVVSIFCNGNIALKMAMSCYLSNIDMMNAIGLFECMYHLSSKHILSGNPEECRFKRAFPVDQSHIISCVVMHEKTQTWLGVFLVA